MYVLYLDDAGSVRNPDDQYFVLARVGLFERQIHYLSKELNSIASKLKPLNPYELEFHGNAIFSGRGWWRRIMNRPDHNRIISDGLRTIDAIYGKAVLFGAAVDKQAVSPSDPIELAFEQVCSRFDQYLGRLHKQNNTQRGMIVLDRSTRETRLQSLATEFRRDGHTWGKLYNLADVPLFVDSRATRSVQYADLVAYSIRRYYEKKDDQFLAQIKHHFDNEGGSLHGLVHVRDKSTPCVCQHANQHS